MGVLDLQGIRERIQNDYYKNKKLYPMKTESMKDGYITDENQSVKWNREQVELAKEQYKNEMDSYRAEDYRLEKLFRQDILDFITNICHHSNKAAIFIYNQAWDRRSFQWTRKCFR